MQSGKHCLFFRFASSAFTRHTNKDKGTQAYINSIWYTFLESSEVQPLLHYWSISSAIELASAKNWERSWGFMRETLRPVSMTWIIKVHYLWCCLTCHCLLRVPTSKASQPVFPTTRNQRAAMWNYLQYLSNKIRLHKPRDCQQSYHVDLQLIQKRFCLTFCMHTSSNKSSLLKRRVKSIPFLRRLAQSMGGSGLKGQRTTPSVATIHWKCILKVSKVAAISCTGWWRRPAHHRQCSGGYNPLMQLLKY